MTSEIVELALPDGKILPRELTDAYLTKIGGRPTWPLGLEEMEGKLGLERDGLKCGSCGSALFLVLQMDCPWTGEEAFFDRIMYVFGCNSRVCTETQGSKAWKAFVVQMPKKGKPGTDAAPSKPTTSLWDSVMLGGASQAMSTLSLQDSTDDNDEPCSVYEKEYPVGFPPLRLHICEEMIRETRTSCRESFEGDAEMIPAAYRVDAGEQWGGEQYESVEAAMGVDKAFMAFQKRVSSYPRQCVRFSPSGRPLPFHQDNAISGGGRCGECGRERVFELQLMPAILSLLPCGEEEHVKHLPATARSQHPVFGDGMEWGTVVVFSCGTCTRRMDGPSLIRAHTHTQTE